MKGLEHWFECNVLQVFMAVLMDKRLFNWKGYVT